MIVLLCIFAGILSGCQKETASVSSTAVNQSAVINQEQNSGEEVTTQKEEPATAEGKADPNQNAVMLPQTERPIEEEENNEAAKSDQINDPFAGPILLKGVMLKGGSGSLAIIEAGGTSYICGEGEKIAGGWKVENIEYEQVLLKKDAQEMVIYLSNPAASKITSGGNEQ